jgi:hypothetical protein
MKRVSNLESSDRNDKILMVIDEHSTSFPSLHGYAARSGPRYQASFIWTAPTGSNACGLQDRQAYNYQM